MTTPSNIHPFNLLAQHFAELVARHLQGSAHAPAAKEPKARAAASSPRKKGQKRSAALIEKTTGELLAHIKAHKGERIEEIAEKLGVTTKDLKLSAQKLLANKKVKTKGVKRATRYYPA